MPPKMKVTKEDILSAAVQILRQQGVQGINARTLAGKLGCSTQPIFSNYTGMEALKADVLRCGQELFVTYLQRERDRGEYPPYKASGMAYIRFAKEETEFFKLLFMRQRSAEEIQSEAGSVDEIISLIRGDTGLSYETAARLHLEMWIFVHGIATMLVSSYLDWEWSFISGLLTDAYLGVKDRFMKEAQ